MTSSGPEPTNPTTLRCDLNETFDILERTPAVLDALLRGTSAEWHAINEDVLDEAQLAIRVKEAAAIPG